MIDRIVTPLIFERIGRKKAILILGPRQTGKTTLVKMILAKHPGGGIYMNADEP